MAERALRPDDRIRTVSIRQGLGWLLGAAHWVRVGTPSLVGIGALWLIVSMLAILPVVGQVILAIITPLLTAGVLLAFDDIKAKRLPRPSILFSAWYRPKAKVVLLLLGVWTVIAAMVALTFLATWLGTQISEQELQKALESPEGLNALIDRLSIGAGLYAAIAVGIFWLMALYFAIPLVIFGEASLWVATRASLKAIVMNTPAFMAYLLTLVVLVGGFVFALVGVVGMVSQLPGALGLMLAQVLILVMSMLLQITLTGAQYLAFCDIFGWSAE
jgi:hypothetical protein